MRPSRPLGLPLVAGLFAFLTSTLAFAAGPRRDAPPELVVEELLMTWDCNYGAIIANRGGPLGPLPASAGPILVDFVDADGIKLGTAKVSNLTEGYAKLEEPFGPRRVHVGIDRFGGLDRDKSYSAELRGPAGIITTTAAVKVSGKTSCKRDIDIVSVKLSPKCTPIVELKHKGTAPLPAAWYVPNRDRVLPRSTWTFGVNLYRQVDGEGLRQLALHEFDPERKLMQPGSTLFYEEPPSARAYEHFLYYTIHQGMTDDKDRKTGKVKGACAAPKPTPEFDLAVTGFVTKPNCEFSVVVGNISKVPGPKLSDASIHHLAPDGGRDGMSVRNLDVIVQPGGRETVRIGQFISPTPGDLSVTFDYTDMDGRRVVDMNPENGRRVLKNYSCTPT
ncbi:MAG: hypothetical protein FJ096_14405 [Deltaproteobacteria bacterium]|nr:hypothetical protein [Deltaproteobacteria bacterium]